MLVSGEILLCLVQISTSEFKFNHNLIGVLSMYWHRKDSIVCICAVTAFILTVFYITSISALGQDKKGRSLSVDKSRIKKLLKSSDIFSSEDEDKELDLTFNPAHECDWCHDVHGAITFVAKDPYEALCLGCHGPGGSSGVEAAAHSNRDNSQYDPFRMSCLDCHNPHSDPDSWVGGVNIKLVGKHIGDEWPWFGELETPNNGVRYVTYETRGTGGGDPSMHSFADNDEDGNGYFDGVCETCHTQTKYHRNNEGDSGHFIGATCVSCHPHTDGFMPTGGECDSCHGQPPDGDTFPNTAGSHAVHMSLPRGPGIIDCGVCHLMPGGGGSHMNNVISFASGTDTNNDGDIDLTETDVCNNCHGADGAFDGVDDVNIGARLNWGADIYIDGDLAAGKEAWCAGCHDLGSSVINGISAPPVVGDNSTWGYFATGHGRTGSVICTDCHDINMVHTDGEDQSYEAALDNYQTGFRLNSINGREPLVVPRTGFDWDDPYTDPGYWELCFSCHDQYALLGGPTAPPDGPYYTTEFETNFRSDSSVIIPDGYGTDIAVYSVSGAIDVNSHYDHMKNAPPHYFDSDHDGELDSYGTCVACHNVHGSSSSSAMIRDGKMIGFEPGLNYGRSRYDRHDPPRGGCENPIIMTTFNLVPLLDSHGGVMRANSGPAANGVCNFCHGGGAGTGDPEYYINCYDPDNVDYYRVPVVPPLPSG